MSNPTVKVKGGRLREVVTNEAYGSLIILLAVIVVATLLQGTQFLSATNMLNIVRNNAVVGIIAVGMTLVIISGGIDLSVGSALVLVGAVIISVTNMTNSSILGMVVGIVVGMALGAVNGLIITKGNVPPFIVTLGMMSICRSVSQFYLNGGGISSVDKNYRYISNTKLFDLIPLPIFYFVIIAVIFWIVARKTSIGRHVYAVGSNEKATKLSSINVDKVKVITYTLIGLCVALAAIVETSRMNSINSSSSGLQYEMDAISAVIVGGTSMAGGKGSIMGTLCGVLIIGIINNMMVLLGVPPFLVDAVKGIVLVLAVLLQRKEQV